MKTLKPIINALLILLMAIYGLAMLALLILPFVNVANLGVTGWSQSYNLPSILP